MRKLGFILLCLCSSYTGAQTPAISSFVPKHEVSVGHASWPHLLLSINYYVKGSRYYDLPLNISYERHLTQRSGIRASALFVYYNSYFKQRRLGYYSNLLRTVTLDYNHRIPFRKKKEWGLLLSPGIAFSQNIFYYKNAMNGYRGDAYNKRIIQSTGIGFNFGVYKHLTKNLAVSMDLNLYAGPYQVLYKLDRKVTFEEPRSFFGTATRGLGVNLIYKW